MSLLNMLNDLAFEPAEESVEMGPKENERARRMCYQSSLTQISTLIRQMWNRVNIKEADRKAPMAESLTDEQDAEMAKAIKLLVGHPVWTAAWDRDEKMSAVKTALENNQEAKVAFGDVGFDLAYLVMGKDLSKYKEYWG